MKKLQHYEGTEISLDDEQSGEMDVLTSMIDKDHSDELEKLFLEGN